jgi:HPt (histidine-containing phosphotransfer) domain-containing protein
MLTKPRFNSDSPDSSPQPHVDIERFRADLREAGVEEMIGDLLETFIQDAPARFAAVEEAARSRDAKAIATAAHAFKSSATTIRASALGEMLYRAEVAGRANSIESLRELVEQIRTEHLAVLRELEAIR